VGCGKVCVGCRTERTQNSAPSPFPRSTSTQMHVNLVDYEIWVIIKRRMTKIRSVRERGLTD